MIYRGILLIFIGMVDVLYFKLSFSICIIRELNRGIDLICCISVTQPAKMRKNLINSMKVIKSQML